MATQRAKKSQVEQDYIQVILTSNQTIGATPTVVLFDTTQLSSGSKLTRVNNTVLVGAGVSRVRISYTLMSESASGAGYVFSRIRKGSTEVSQMIDNASSAAFKATSETKIVPVAQGDVITLIADCGSGTFVLNTGRHPFMLVEVVE